MASKLADQLNDDIKTAMKAKESEAVMALRMLLAAVKDQTVNAGKEVTDDVVVEVVTKAIKQRKDAIEQFAAAGRADLVAKEEAQIVLYERYQPPQLDKEELTALVQAAITESGAQSKREIGKVMQVLMPQVKGRADGKLVNQVVQALLP